MHGTGVKIKKTRCEFLIPYTKQLSLYKPLDTVSFWQLIMAATTRSKLNFLKLYLFLDITVYT